MFKKSFTAIVLIVACVAMLLPTVADAQKTQGNPFTDISYKYYPLATNRTFVASQGDSAVAPLLRIGGCNRASYTLKVSDTASVYVNVEYRVLGETGWNTTHRDTITHAPADSAAKTFTYPLRYGTIDYIGSGNLDVQTRLRLIFPASGQSVIGTNKYWLTLNWKD